MFDLLPVHWGKVEDMIISGDQLVSLFSFSFFLLVLLFVSFSSIQRSSFYSISPENCTFWLCIIT